MTPNMIQGKAAELWHIQHFAIDGEDESERLYSSVHEDLTRWVMTHYGYLVPLFVEIDGAQFAHLIEQAYYCGPLHDGPINNTAAETVLRVRGTFHRTYTDLVYTGAKVPRLS